MYFSRISRHSPFAGKRFRPAFVLPYLLAAPLFALPVEAQTNLAATPGNSEVVLKWDGSSTTKLFSVQRATSPDGTYTTLVSNWSKSDYYDSNNSLPLYVYTDATAVNGTAYYYQVIGVGGTTAGPTSQMVPFANTGWTGGWVQQHRQSTFGTSNSEYDITGLTGKYTYSTGKVTNPTIYLGDFLGNAAYFSLNLGKSLPHLLLNGMSTFTWKWILPANPQGLQNDPNKSPNDPSQPFPIPPLYALAVVDPYADATPGTNTTMACTATITDGWGWSQSFAIPSSQTPQIPNTADPRRKIVSAVLRSDNVNSDVKLSPSVKVDISSTGTGKAYGYLTEQADALTLDYPTPNVRPDLGDPNAPDNQFVYSSDANGSLTMRADMRFSGITSNIDWLTNQKFQSYRYAESLVDWQMDRPDVPAPGGGQPARAATERLPNHNEQNSVGQLNPYTVGYNSRYGLVGPSTVDASTSQNLPALIFNGLPLHNVGFGNHTVTLGIKSDPGMAQNVYSPSQTAYIQTFFPGLATNWPSSDGVTPNWYYYYNQVFPVMGASNDYDAQYSPDTGVSFTQYDGSNPEQPTGHIQLKNDAYPSDAHPSYTMHVFDISPNPDPDDGNYYVRFVGTLQMYGIMSYIYVAAHEQGHVDTFRTNVTITSPSGQSYTSPIITMNTAFGDPYVPSSSDGDTVWDAWESQHHMMSGKPDTTGAYGVLTNGDVADSEVVADIDAFEHVFAQVDAGAWRVDWADQGLNAQPYFVQEPYNNKPNNLGKAPTFYIKFSPASGVTPYPNQAGIQPVLTKDGYYEIRNMQDLKNLYPNLVTNLGQM